MRSAVRISALVVAFGIGATAVGAGVASADTGRVNYYNPEKQTGFITPDDGGPDLFFHSSYFVGNWNKSKVLPEYLRVSFQVTTGPKGKQALGIFLAESGSLDPRDNRFVPGGSAAANRKAATNDGGPSGKKVGASPAATR